MMGDSRFNFFHCVFLLGDFWAILEQPDLVAVYVYIPLFFFLVVRLEITCMACRGMNSISDDDKGGTCNVMLIDG